MASNLGCVGLAIEDVAELERLLDALLPASLAVGRVDDVVVRQWQDPSGSRLTLSMRGNDVLDLVPSFAARPGARLGSVSFVSDEVAYAAVLDDSGEQVTALTLELEERRLLRAHGAPIDGTVAITALGVEVEVFASPAEFAASDASYLAPPDDDRAEPPSHFAEAGWEWPPRVGPESFFSYGAFAEPDVATAHARLSGTVLDGRSHTVALTGQAFVEARVRTAGFEAHVCFPADEHGPPAVGSVVHGTVFLVGSLGAPPARSRLRWWSRSR